MRNDARLFSPLGIMTMLCSVVLATPSQAASAIVNMSATLTDSNGVTRSVDDSLLLGGDRNEAEIGITTGGAAFARVQTTFEAEPIGQYAAVLGDPWYRLFGDTLWWTKQSAHLYIDPQFMDAVVSVEATRTRGAENYAIYAVAPGSASGFSNDGGKTSIGGGNAIRLLLTGYFNGGSYSQQPRFVFGDGFSDPYGEPPGPDFNATLQAYNQGFAIIVDLNAAGVPVGDDYTFYQRYRLGVGPGVFLDGNDLAFVNIDPIIGYATMIVPEPATLRLLAMALLSLALVCWQRRRIRIKKGTHLFSLSRVVPCELVPRHAPGLARLHLNL